MNVIVGIIRSGSCIIGVLIDISQRTTLYIIIGICNRTTHYCVVSYFTTLNIIISVSTCGCTSGGIVCGNRTGTSTSRIGIY